MKIDNKSWKTIIKLILGLIAGGVIILVIRLTLGKP